MPIHLPSVGTLSATLAFPTRALSTTYQNTNSTPIIAMVSALCHHGDNSGGAYIQALVDTVTPPVTSVGMAGHHYVQSTLDKRHYETITFIVPAGYYYRVNSVITLGGGLASIVLQSWTESVLSII